MVNWDDGQLIRSYNTEDLIHITWNQAGMSIRISWLQQIYGENIDFSFLAKRDFEDLPSADRKKLIRMGPTILPESPIDFSEVEC
jgi:hypothetical protein